MNIQDELRKTFNNDNRYLQSAIQDLFAIGCYFHASGKHTLGIKTCATALRAVKCNEEKQILDYVRSHERECFEAAWPHSELSPLLNEMQPS